MPLKACRFESYQAHQFMVNIPDTAYIGSFPTRQDIEVKVIENKDSFTVSFSAWEAIGPVQFLFPEFKSISEV